MGKRAGGGSCGGRTMVDDKFWLQKGTVTAAASSAHGLAAIATGGNWDRKSNK